MRFKIDVQGLQGLDDDLFRLAKAYPDLAYRALREGARAGRQEFLKLVFDELTISKGKARTIVRPIHEGKTAIWFTIRSTNIGLQHFEVVTTSTGIRVRIAKAKGWEEIPHAFQWGNRGFFIRKRYQPAYGPISFKGKGVNWKAAGRGQPKGGRSKKTGLVFRHPIKRLEGRRLTSHLSHSESRIMANIERVAFDEFDRQLTRLAKKRAGQLRDVV